MPQLREPCIPVESDCRGCAPYGQDASYSQGEDLVNLLDMPGEAAADHGLAATDVAGWFLAA